MRRHFRPLFRSLAMAGLIPWLCFGGVARSAPAGAVAPPTNQTPAASASVAAPQPDTAAAKFMTACAGCHSLSGAKLNGPELSPVATWPVEQLKAAVKRMEKNVGPLTESEVNMLTDLLRDPTVRERLKAEEARIQAQFTAKMEPPNADVGRSLFFGRAPLKNGGLPCAACHAAAGQGGSLGPDLNGVFARMGQTPLVSAIEKASFKVMEPHYRRHPVTKQEAMHLARYCSTLNPSQPTPVPASFVPVGAGAAFALLVGLTFSLRSQRQSRGRDTKLQRRRK
jgi:ubiquinol-cytochrome c reductase cytochrome c subunit